MSAISPPAGLADLHPPRPAAGAGGLADRLTLAHVWIGVVLTFAGAATGAMTLEAIDYWWTIKLGELIWQSGSLPSGDPLVHTPIREPVIAGQWLAQLLFYAVHSAGGPELALTLRMLVGVAVAALLLEQSVAGGAGIRASAIAVALGMLLIGPGLAVRPQLLAVIPFLVVARAAASPPRLLPGVGVAAAVAFWANVHGSFVLAYALLGAGLVEALWSARRGEGAERLRRAVRLTALCAFAPLANPYGPELLRYVVDTVLFNAGALAVDLQAAEWGPPGLRTRHGLAFFGSVGLVLVLLARGERPRLGEGLLLATFGLLTLDAARNMLWWGLVLTPYLARGVGRLALAAGQSRAGAAPPGTGTAEPAPPTCAAAGRAMPPGRPALNAACLVLVGLVLAAHVPLWRTLSPLPVAQVPLLDPSTPVGLGEYLAANQPSGLLFNAADWGGYLGWRLGPARKIFVDDRYELHPPEVWRDYVIVSRGHASWETILRSYGVTQLALDPRSQGGLVRALETSDDWALAYRDEQALVFERRSARR